MAFILLLKGKPQKHAEPRVKRVKPESESGLLSLERHPTPGNAKKTDTTALPRHTGTSMTSAKATYAEVRTYGCLLFRNRVYG
jgi:hypothetical protein